LKNILFRVDASYTIGLGHITRCIALAKQFSKINCNIYFAIKNNKITIDLLKKNKLNFIIARNNLSTEYNYSIWIEKIIKRHYIDTFIGDIRDGLPIKLIKKLKKKNILTIAIDEPSRYAKECDICFYPPHAKINQKEYKGKIYQGIEYIILRDEFYKNYQKKKNNIPNILVMMGGTDPYNLTLEVVKQLLTLKQNFNISVVIKKEHQDYDTLNNLSQDIKIYSDIKNMAKFLTKIDFAIISFGVTAYELIAMKTPSIHICLDKDHWNASKWFEDNKYGKRIKKNKLDYIKDIKWR